MNTRPLIIVHGDCFDGMGAAWVCQRYFTRHEHVEPEFFFAKYGPGQSPPDVTGRDVIMFDFSYKRAILEEMKAAAGSLLVFDHHATAKDDLEGLDYCVFDMDFSGAHLAWQYFFGDDDVPQLIKYIEDRDLWKFKLPQSKAINAAIGSYPMTLESFETLHNILSTNSGWESIYTEGKALLRQQELYYQLIAEQAIWRTLPKQFGPFEGTEVLVANCPYQFASSVGNILAEKAISNIGICWFQRKDGNFQYSIRGVGNVDVQAIAKAVGGGGHKLAAGFESKELYFND